MNGERVARWQWALPSIITLLRLALLPAIWFLWVHGQIAASMVLYSAAMLTDVLDGRVARRLGTSSTVGAFLDVISDVLFLVVLLILLGLADAIHPWIFLAPVSAATVFFLTSGSAAPRYDPIGKHYGGILFVAVGGFLLCSYSGRMCAALSSLIAVLSVIVVLNRLQLSLRRRVKQRISC